MEKFKLVSPFQPTGDQPESIKKLTEGLNKDFRFQTLLGATGTGKTFTMASVIEKAQKPTLVIAHNKTLAAQLASEFREFFPENAVEYFVSYYDYYQPEAYVPQADLYIEKDAQINEEIDRLRLSATKAILERKDVIIVSSVSCIYSLGSPQVYKESTVSLFKGQTITITGVAKRLVELQYQRNDFELKRGTFSIKGDVLEIYPAYEKTAIKVELFGDTIDKLTIISFPEREKVEEVQEVSISPAKHYLVPKNLLVNPLKQVRQDLNERLRVLKNENKLVEAQRLESRTNYDLEMIEQLGYCGGIENYSRYFDGRKSGEPPYTLLDYFLYQNEDYLLFIDESHITLPQIRGMWHGERARKETLINFGFRLPSAIDNRPLTFDEFLRKIRKTVFVSATPTEYELNQSEQVSEQIIRPTGITDPEIEIRKPGGQIQDLIMEIEKRVKKGERVLVTTLTKRTAEELSFFLQDYGIKVMYLHSDIKTLERVAILRDLRLGVYDCLVGINLLREGLDLPEVSLVAILDADKEGFLRSQTSLIQTIGRAARHVEAKVIMYAEVITDSMKRAIDETNRRRDIQLKFNQENGITPRSIQKTIHDISEKVREVQPEAASIEELDVSKISPEKLKQLLKELEQQMKLAVEEQEFEKAALIRDQIFSLKGKSSS